MRMLCLSLVLLLSACHLNSVNEGIIDFQTQNYREAFIRLKPAADKSNADAQYAIGYMYYYGVGVAENKRLALIYISKAAGAGQADAIKALDILTRRPKQVIDSSDATNY